MPATTVDTAASSPIESREQFDRPASYWHAEIRGSQRILAKWHKQGDRIVNRYLDHRTSDTEVGRDRNAGRFKLNLFFANVKTLQSLLYGRLPKVDVSRRYNDANDDAGRVAAVLMERMLNNDLNDNADHYNSILRSVIEDRLVPGLGVTRVRYDCDTELQTPYESDPSPVIALPSKVITGETANTDYVHWRDMLWSWSRTYAGLRWVAFRSYHDRDAFKKRWPKADIDQVDFKTQKAMQTTRDAPVTEPETDDYWQRAEVWELWDRDKRKVVYIHLNCDALLETRDDPLELANFFPTPPFLLANPSTTLYVPTPDWHMAQDLYNEVDKLQTRIAIITEAVRVVGVYDSSTPEIARMLKEGTENDLIAVDKWALFAEKGGLKGAVDWFPIEDVVNALVNLRQVRDETISLLYQVTGMADVMRGELANQYEGVGQTDTKMEFASIRVQSVQEDVSGFVTCMMQLKAEVIARHFTERSIIEQSNAESLEEQPETIAEAVALIKDPRKARLKVKVSAESMAMADYAKLQTERANMIASLSALIQASAPLLETIPGAGPYLMKLFQWALAGFRGADEIEGVFDKAIEDAQNQPEDKSNPEADKAAAQAQLEQAKTQAQLQIIQAKMQAELQTRQSDLQADIATRQAEHQMRLNEIAGEVEAEVAKIEAKAKADMTTELFQSEVNAEQQAAGVEAELNKDIIVHKLDLERDAVATANKIRESQAAAAAKPASPGDDD